jgi:peptide deformylase
MVKKILRSGDPILRNVSKPIVKIDKKVLSLIQDLIDTLLVQKDPEGVGLAAPQIGKNLRVFVMLYDKKIKAVINPEIVKTNRTTPKNAKKDKIMEGCLSLPYYYGPLTRFGTITLKYLDEEGREITETLTGLKAQIVQHEVDHLNGILFVDRLLAQKKKLYKLNKSEWEEVSLT